MNAVPRKSTSGDLRLALENAAREAGALRAVFSAVVARRLGVNATDLECLDVVASRPDICAGDLAALTGLTTGAVTGVIDRLERRGFVRRERDALDRRRVLVRLTAGAIAATAPHCGALAETAGTLARRYSDEQAALMIDYFSQMRAIILAELGRLAEPADPPT